MGTQTTEQGQKTPDGTADPRPRKGRRWRRRLLILGMLLTCLFLFRAPLLRLVGAFLIREEPDPGAAFVLILDGDNSFAEAARLHHASQGSQLLLVERRPNRLVRLGILEPLDAVARKELVSLGVPEHAIHVIPGAARTEWEIARRLHGWLEQHAGVHVRILCRRFGTRQVRHILDETLGPEDAERVSIRGLVPHAFDEASWWTCRDGILEVFNSYTRLWYTYVCGGDSEEWREWDEDAYEAALR